MIDVFTPPVVSFFNRPSLIVDARGVVYTVPTPARSSHAGGWAINKVEAGANQARLVTIVLVPNADDRFFPIVAGDQGNGLYVDLAAGTTAPAKLVAKLASSGRSSPGVQRSWSSASPRTFPPSLWPAPRSSLQLRELGNCSARLVWGSGGSIWLIAWALDVPPGLIGCAASRALSARDEPRARRGRLRDRGAWSS